MATVSRAGARPERRLVVGPLAELPPGSACVVDASGREIAVFNDDGRLHALRNVCPHHGAPLCRGRVAGFMRIAAPYQYDYSGDDEGDRVVLCPWHGYKFRLSDGSCTAVGERMSVRTYRVEVEDGDVVVYL